MERWTPLVLVAIISLIFPVSITSGAPGTRTTDLVFYEIILSGEQGPSGEYSVGAHELLLAINNTAGTDHLGMYDFHINITYSSNSTVLIQTVEIGIVFVEASSTALVNLTDLEFPEDRFEVRINATIEGSELMLERSVLIRDHLDLSIIGSSFERGAHYIRDAVFQPRVDILYESNMKRWSENLYTRLVVVSHEPAISEVYNGSVWFMLEGPEYSISSGHVFHASFTDWPSSTFGHHTASFHIQFNDSDPSNDIFTVDFSIELGMYIEGWIEDDEGSPLENVTVELTKGSNTVNSTLTDGSGHYRMDELDAGSYKLSLGKRWYHPVEINVTVIEGMRTLQNSTMIASDRGGLEGWVLDPTDGQVEGARVVIENGEKQRWSTISNLTGHYRFESIPSGPYKVWAEMEGYGEAEESLVMVIKHEITYQDLELSSYFIKLSFEPPDGQENVSIEEIIVITFSSPLNLSTIWEDSIVLRNSISGEIFPVYVDVWNSNSSLFIFPYYGYEYDTWYELEIKRDISSSMDIPLGRNITYRFKTEPYRAEIVVSSTYPENGAEDFPIDGILSVTFPADLDPSTVNESTITVILSTGDPILVNINYSAPQKTIYIDPVGELLEGEWYSIYLSPEISVVSDEYIFFGHAWSFRVEEILLFGSIMGSVTDIHGDPISPDLLDIRMIYNDEVLRMPVVSSNGSFKQSGLEPGIWEVTFSAFGYQEYTVTEFVFENETTDMGTIFLYREQTSTTIANEFDNEVIAGSCCIVTLLIIIIILVSVNKRMRAERESDRKKIEKLEYLLDRGGEE